MIWTVGVLAVLSAIGGLHPVRAVLGADHALARPGRRAARSRRPDTQELIASVCAVALGLAGIGVAWLLYVRKRRPVPKPWPLLEKKFYWDELYDLRLLPARPICARARALRASSSGR